MKQGGKVICTLLSTARANRVHSCSDLVCVRKITYSTNYSLGSMSGDAICKNRYTVRSVHLSEQGCTCILPYSGYQDQLKVPGEEIPKILEVPVNFGQLFHTEDTAPGRGPARTKRNRHTDAQIPRHRHRHTYTQRHADAQIFRRRRINTYLHRSSPPCEQH